MYDTNSMSFSLIIASYIVNVLCLSKKFDVVYFRHDNNKAYRKHGTKTLNLSHFTDDLKMFRLAMKSATRRRGFGCESFYTCMTRR